MCWLPIVHNLAIEPYVVQIMGIIHYLFIAGQEDENAYLPVAQKMLCHILWLYGQWKISLPKFQKWPQTLQGQ